MQVRSTPAAGDRFYGGIICSGQCRNAIPTVAGEHRCKDNQGAECFAAARSLRSNFRKAVGFESAIDVTSRQLALHNRRHRFPVSPRILNLRDQGEETVFELTPVAS